MVPEAIPAVSAVAPSGSVSTGQVTTPTPSGAPGGFTGSTPSPSPGGAPIPPQPKTVEFSFAADRTKLYVAWQALANLADLCGNITVSVKGEPPEGANKSKLENGVYEPLREANLIE
jgi:hypothetical protein